MLLFDDVCLIARKASGWTYERMCANVPVKRSTFNKWKSGERRPRHTATKLAEAMFGLPARSSGYESDRDPSDAVENEETYKRIIAELEDLGFTDEPQLRDLVTRPYRKGSCAKLCKELVLVAIDNAEMARDVVAELRESTPENEVFPWKHVQPKDRKRIDLLERELEGYERAIREHMDSAITDYSGRVSVDVSRWPEKPFRINYAIAQRRIGAEECSFRQCYRFHEKLRSDTFRYTRVVLYGESADDVLLSLEEMPHYRDSPEEQRGKLGEWEYSISYRLQEVSNPSNPTLKILEYELHRADGYRVLLRSWDSYSAAFSWLGQCAEDAPQGGHQGSYYSSDLHIKAPEGRSIWVETECALEGWSMAYSVWFTSPVYEPNITAEIINSGNRKDDYVFHLTQHSSQSPFWRRSDGNSTVSDVSAEYMPSSRIQWSYPGQWLMIGEGFAVVLETGKREKQ